jgi:hypothetical protein
MANTSRSGGCLCGAVRFSAVPDNLEMDVCHCGMCRRWSGGTLMSVPCTKLEIVDDSDLGVYASSEWAERLFCKSCGSSLFWRLSGGKGEGHVAVSMQSFDDISGFEFLAEIYIDEKPPHYTFAGERMRKTGAEVVAEFMARQADHG